MNDRVMLIETGLESAQDKASTCFANANRNPNLAILYFLYNDDYLFACWWQVDVVSHSPAAPALWILISLLGVTCLLFSVIGLYCMFSLTLTARPGSKDVSCHLYIISITFKQAYAQTSTHIRTRLMVNSSDDPMLDS